MDRFEAGLIVVSSRARTMAILPPNAIGDTVLRAWWGGAGVISNLPGVQHWSFEDRPAVIAWSTRRKVAAAAGTSARRQKEVAAYDSRRHRWGEHDAAVAGKMLCSRVSFLAW